MATTKEVLAPTSADLPTDYKPYQPGESWASMTQEADKIAGHDLAKDEMLDALVGVPFMVTRVTTRKGTVRNGMQCDYMSCEIVIAPEAELIRRKVDLTRLPFMPEDQVVFNDGSTGIYRQVMFYLTAKGYIVLPEGLPTEGKLGESIYDLPVSEWAEIKRGTINFDPDGHPQYNADVRLYCPRGIRKSEYANEYTQDGATRYLA